MDSSDLNDLAGFEWIRNWIAVTQEGDALIEPGSEENYPATIYRTSICKPVEPGSERPGLDLVLLAGAESNGFFPGVILGGRRLGMDEFGFSLQDDNVILSLYLTGSCTAEDDLYQDANVIFTPTGAGFSGTIVSTCKQRHVFMRWTGSVA